MKQQVSISIYLDTRRAKDSGKYPVKLRVYDNNSKKAKFYSIEFEYSKGEFHSIWETVKPRKEFQELREQLDSVQSKAREIAKEIPYFTFDAFEKNLFRKSSDRTNVFYHYDEAINKLRQNEQLGTASNYNLSKKSIIEFLKYKKRKSLSALQFAEINALWLNDYESYMVKVLGRSYTTVSMYLRALRTIFNAAIKSKDIPGELYPFTKDTYVVPGVQKVRKALNRSQLKTLFDAMPGNKEQEKAKDFWFFSFICNGMNIKDIALLRYENLKSGNLEFYRAKTERTAKKQLKPVVVYLTEYANGIIEKYGNPKANSQDYIFPILATTDNAEQRRTKIQNFTRFINQNFKKYAQQNGVTDEISTYWARHSYATQAIRNGASMEFVSEALNHSNIQVTQGYFAGFEDETKRDLAESLMKF